MPSRPRSGVVGKYIELPPELVAAAEVFAADRHQKFREVVIEALRRHLAYPPPPPVEQPLTPLPDAAPKRGRGRPPKPRDVSG